ncbi:sodium-dependent lysophosphatidylcholine symporter 1-like [Corticium candelabrum]|uniref:sodium-dependent lysophosphatidylcholine symporter 1-like n=1 Tax=Corticium candelabrum TaxID=121492 RepID=UPI002E26917E|nr:sodium-dependent lysophosphatidylcholine symporter 1-like [Corticium candelabrum]
MMIYLCAWLMVSLVQTNLALYVQYVLDMESQFQYVIILLLVVVVFSIPMWQLFLLRFGKKTTYATGITLVLPALFAFLYIGADDNYVVWPLAVISGIGIGSAYLVPWSMLPDAIDEAAARDGVRRESLFYAFFVFWQKFSTGIALALSTLALQVFGDYKTGQCNQPLSVSLTLRLLISTGPILLIILSFYFTWRYPITETKRWEIKQTLESRRNENATKSYQTSTNRTSRGKKPAEQSDAVDGVTSDTNVDTWSAVSGLAHPQTS